MGREVEVSPVHLSSVQTISPCRSLISSPITSPASSSTIPSPSPLPLAARFATSSTLGSSCALNINPLAFASISTGVQMARMTLWREKGRETEEKPPRSIRLKSRTSCVVKIVSSGRLKSGGAHVQHLRHHLQRAFQRGVLDRRLRLVVERFRPLKVLHGEESGVEGYSDLVEDVVRELEGEERSALERLCSTRRSQNSLDDANPAIFSR